MTTEQIIEEILMEASEFGIRENVLKESKKYMDKGMSKLQAIETAYSDLMEIQDESSYIDDDDDEYIELDSWDSADIEDWGDDDDDDDYRDDDVYDDDDY